MKLPVKRLILGSAVAVAALGAGGIAYAAGSDPAVPEQGYVTVEEGATTPSPSKDCPEKNGSGAGEGTPQPSEQNPAGNA
ncbi:hypothetical protein [Kribbella sindirgiensis]|uniref:Secreted protein n=1 Tax=Kribbella sindirgiensis TaxID=1124744 RepID=A0A4R0HWN8_9ACTN|nr:hypothetical protein [Kribbella sindirgiensis]TCC15476.1 hypothetical protein E0H50_41785 [Kribbella sindirgiensis]